MDYHTFEKTVFPKFVNGEELFVEFTKKGARKGTIGKIIDIPAWSGNSKYPQGTIKVWIDKKHTLNYGYSFFKFLPNYIGPTKYVFIKKQNLEESNVEVYDIVGQKVEIGDVIAYMDVSYNQLEVGTISKITAGGQLKARSYGFHSSYKAGEKLVQKRKFISLKNGLTDAVLLKRLAT